MRTTCGLRYLCTLVQGRPDLVAGAISSQELPTYTRTLPTLVYLCTLVQPRRSSEKSKTEAMHFPSSPNAELSHDVRPDPFQISILHHIHFTHEFCYLGSIITADLCNDRDSPSAFCKATQQKKPLMYLPSV
jgi:hypothetical protein